MRRLLIGLFVLVLAIPGSGAVSARQAEALKISTFFTAKGAGQHLANDKGIDQAIDNCRKINVTKVYIECYRGGHRLRLNTDSGVSRSI